MTNQQHPITPPPELVEEWANAAAHEFDIAKFAARWGADQELESCCQALYARYDIPNCIFPKMAEDMREWLRAARRPKPPSLKGQALIELGDVYNRNKIDDVTYDTIRLALEQLND
jgi:hypothetical protein